MKILFATLLVAVCLSAHSMTVHAASEDIELVLTYYEKNEIEQLIKEYKAVIKSLQGALKELKKGKASKYYETIQKKGKNGTGVNNAVINSTLNNIRAQAEITANQSDGSVDYTGICSTAAITQMLTSIDDKNGQGNIYCKSNATAYAVSVALASPLKGSFACVDSTGVSVITKKNISGSTIVCPAK
jgi:hypothetical protein